MRFTYKHSFVFIALMFGSIFACCGGLSVFGPKPNTDGELGRLRLELSEEKQARQKVEAELAAERHAAAMHDEPDELLSLRQQREELEKQVAELQAQLKAAGIVPKEKGLTQATGRTESTAAQRFACFTELMTANKENIDKADARYNPATKLAENSRYLGDLNEASYEAIRKKYGFTKDEMFAISAEAAEKKWLQRLSSK